MTNRVRWSIISLLALWIATPGVALAAEAADVKPAP